MQIDPELEAIKLRVKEMEEGKTFRKQKFNNLIPFLEAEKLKQLQSEVNKQMIVGSPTSTSLSVEEKMEIDNRSIYVGNVDYGATAEELEAHFHGCGSINRVTILCNKVILHDEPITMLLTCSTFRLTVIQKVLLTLNLARKILLKLLSP